MPAVDKQEKQVRPDWSRIEAAPAVYANQFITQLGSPTGASKVPDGIYLGIGVTNPPVLTGSPAEIEERVNAINSLEVAAVAKVVMSRPAAQELMRVLEIVIDQYDAAVGQPAQDSGAAQFRA